MEHTKFVAVLKEGPRKRPWLEGMERHLQEGDLLVVQAAGHGNYLTHNGWYLAPSSIEIIGEL